MFKYLLEEKKLQDDMTKHGLNKKDITFIEELIEPKSKDGVSLILCLLNSTSEKNE